MAVLRRRAATSNGRASSPDVAGTRAGSASERRPKELSRVDSPDTDPAIVVEGLWKVYGPEEERARAEIEQDGRCERAGVALRDVAVEIGRGEIFVVVGLSGSGKTTLLRSLNGLITPTAGSVRILGTDIAQGGVSLRQIRSRVGMIFQSFGLLPHRSVFEQPKSTSTTNPSGVTQTGVRPAPRDPFATKAVARRRSARTSAVARDSDYPHPGSEHPQRACAFFQKERPRAATRRRSSRESEGRGEGRRSTPERKRR
jgi:ABC-type glutathione transport system ATPase component